jgi:hypothetical protein
MTDRSIGQLRYMVVSCVAMREREIERERERDLNPRIGKEGT